MRWSLRLVSVCLIVLAGCTPEQTIPSAPPPSPPRKITIAQAGDFFLYAPLYVALDAGFFKRNNLDVTITSTGGDDKTWAAIISGSAAFGVADPTFVAVSDARGVPGQVVASIVNGVPFWGITWEPSIKQFAAPKDLSHHTVATFPAPSTAYTLQREMFLSAGVEPAIREGAFGTIIPMLRAGQADIGLELEPNVSQAVTEGAHVVYSMAATYGDFAITGLTTTPERARRDPALVESVVCSIQQSLDLIRRDRAAALKILTSRFPEIAPPVAKAALDRVINDNIIPSTAAIGDKAWASAIRLRVAAGDITAPKPMTAYVNNSYAQRAAATCR